MKLCYMLIMMNQPPVKEARFKQEMSRRSQSTEAEKRLVAVSGRGRGGKVRRLMGSDY